MKYFSVYRAVLDGFADVKLGSTAWYADFDLQPWAVLDSPAILSFVVNATGSVQALEAVIKINNHTVVQYGPTNIDLTRPFQEVFRYRPNTNTPILKHVGNWITAEVVGGQGTFRISDVIVWYQNAD
jgi:hypothetical protein